MGLMNIDHNGVRRELLVDFDPRWIQKYDGTNPDLEIHLFVGLHGGSGNATGFFQSCRLRMLTAAGTATAPNLDKADPDPYSAAKWTADHPVICAIFPQGLHPHGAVTEGNWDNGWLQRDQRLTWRNDDAGFVVACVDAVEQWMMGRVRQILYDPYVGSPRFVGPPDAPDWKHKLLFGFSNGGAMAYKVAALYPEYFTALAVVGCAHGGFLHFKYRFDAPIPDPSAEGDVFGATWLPNTGWQLPVMHIQGTVDPKMPPGYNVFDIYAVPPTPAVEEAQRYMLTVDAELWAWAPLDPRLAVDAWTTYHSGVTKSIGGGSGMNYTYEDTDPNANSYEWAAGGVVQLA